MEPRVIWIKIDPSLLIQDTGFDCQAFFGVDSFLKFNLTPDETEKGPGNKNSDSKNHPTLGRDGLDTTFKSDIKIEQNIRSEFDQGKSTSRLRQKSSNKQGTPYVCSECGFTVSAMAKLEEHIKVVHNTALRFPCDHCDKMFLRKSLLEHKRFIVDKNLKEEKKYRKKQRG